MINMTQKEQGTRRTMWISADLDAIVEEARKKLGLSKSGFYRYAILRLLQELNVLTTRVEEKNEQP